METTTMEASITSTSVSSSPGPTMSQETPEPAAQQPEPEPQFVGPVPESPTMEAPPPSVPLVDLEEEIDNDVFYDDRIGQVMDILNFTIVPKKPASIFETPLPPGELMPKSHYIEEKKAFLEMVRTHRRDLLKAQVEKLNDSMKLQETENKMHRIVKIIAELHNLYGHFVRSLVHLMRKTQGNNGEVLITIGPFPDPQEVDKFLVVLSSLSNQFQNDFENLSKTKQSLRMVGEYLGEIAKKSLILSSGESPMTTDQMDKGSAEETSGTVSVAAVAGTYNSEDAPTVIISSDDELDQGSSSTATGSTTTDLYCNESLLNISGSSTEGISAAATTSATNLQQSSTSTTIENDKDGDNVTAFVPVLDPNQPNDGKMLYTLVEYPKQMNLINKKHGYDANNVVNGQYHCLCGQKFPTLSLVKYHVRYFSASWKFLCKLCSRKYPGLNFLKLHMLRAHKILYVGTNACNYCPESFQTASEYLRHLQIAHNKKLPSEVEHLTSSSNDGSSLLLQDQMYSPPTEPGGSSTTSSSGGRRGSIPSAVLVVHGTRCACGKELITKEGLVEHIRMEVEAYGQNFKCSVCPETFNHRCNLKSHFREIHGVEYQDYQDRQYGCISCEQMFGSEQELESHMATAGHGRMDNQEEELTFSGQDPLSITDSIENAANSYVDNTITFHIESETMEDDTPVVTIED